MTHHLRKFRNYDSLYAVISGLRETSIIRLAQTHQLVQISLEGQKEFQSHLKLMEPRGGYANYNRTLAEDLAQGRPVIPLL